MDNSDLLQLLIGLSVRQLPILTIALVGLWFAMAHRQKLRRVSTWAAWGFSLLIANVCFNAWVVYLIAQPGALSGGAGSQVISSVLGLSSQLMFVVGLAVLARAVFLDRSAGAARA